MKTWPLIVLLSLAACGARSGLLAVDGASCSHPPVTKDCAGGWCKVPAGCFYLGDEPGDLPCSYPGLSPVPRVQVTLTRSFEIAQHEVTQDQFQSVMGYHVFSSVPVSGPIRKRDCADCPAYWRTWAAAAAYCNALSRQSKLAECYVTTPWGDASAKSEYRDRIHACPGYRLPTEAEWEYAYRAGTRTPLYNGPITACGDDANAALIGWDIYNAIDPADGLPIPQPVGRKTPNPWGIHDMAGNVEEYVHDRYVERVAGESLTDPDPESATTQNERVAKGGAVVHGALLLRAAFRSRVQSSWTGHGFYGIRCARTLE